MCRLFTNRQRLRLLQSALTAQRSTTLLGSLGVLLYALPERLLAADGKKRRSHDRSQ